jgi:tetratricopeptide (TPR) repeat protein
MGESEADFRAALAAFDQAIALYRNYGAAHAQRARALMGISITTSDSGIRDAVRRQARAAAERAVALAPELAEAHVELWRVRLVGFLDLTGAATEIERALALAPGSAYVQRNFGAFAGDLGHHEVALAAVRRAVRLDPQNFRYRVHLATSLYDARRFSEALIAIEDAKALKPESHEVGAFVALNYLALGQSERAQQMCQSPAGLEEDFRARCLALAYRKLGKLKDAESELDKFRALGGDSAAYGYAQIYAQWGERVSAVRWLVMAERLRDPGLLDLRADWMLDPIRNEPEFKALEARMNFTP